MSKSRRTIDNLIQQGQLPIEHADSAAIALEVYPSKHSWRMFFDIAALIIGVVALVLSLVFFIAYNWFNMGKLGKFALVEGALVITIIVYAYLSYTRQYKFIQQLLLLIASIITGSLLALFGQVYQTGADSWELFFSWALLIIPWVIMARLPALWLLWLGLINAFILSYSDVLLYLNAPAFIAANYFYQDSIQITILALVNFIALNLWLASIDRHSSSTPKTSPQTSKTKLHWSTYVVGLLSTYLITYLAIIHIFSTISVNTISENAITTSITIGSLLLWSGWCGFVFWRFYKRQLDVLMLTYLCGSVIAVVMFWSGEWLLQGDNAFAYLLLAVILIVTSSVAVIWLRSLANKDNEAPSIARGDYE